jgi:hypothetical protein
MSRVIAFSWGLGVVLAAALPALRAPHDDAFPFSTYPMFATPREQETLLVAEGVTTEGSIAIPPRYVANGPVMQAMSTLYQAQAQGSGALRKLCQGIAERVQQAPELAGVRRVQIVSARFDPIKYFQDGPEPEARRVLQRCRVGKGP